MSSLSRSILILSAAWTGLAIIPPDSRIARGEIESLSVGIQGNCKLGYWVPARIRFRGALPGKFSVEISLPDTDGMKATFVDQQPLIRNVGDDNLVETLVKLGRSKGTVTVRLRKQEVGSENATAELIAEKSYRVDDVCVPLDPLVELYVSLGRSVEIKGAASLGGINDYAPAASVAIEADRIVDDGGLGNHWRGFDSIDAIVLEAGSFVDRPLPFLTQSALVNWVQQGGKMAITGGEHLGEFFEKNPELAPLFAGKVTGSRRLTSTSAIERSVKASSPVSDSRNLPFVALTESTGGEVLLREGTDPVLLRNHVGFGLFVLATVNLADEPFAQWSDRKSFSGLILSELNFNPEIRRSQDAVSTRFGFEDLSGQLRAALDDFSSVTPVNFTVVAAIAILFICLIGPVDYFLLKRFVKRMEWTWLTFTLIVVLIGGLTYLIHRSTKSDRLLLRQVEVVDVDADTGMMRGTLWSHVYSPDSRKYNISWKPADSAGNTVQHVSWMGYPGDALGGMDNRSVNTSHSAEYRIGLSTADLNSVPINIASTRGLQLDWVGQSSLDRIKPPSLVRNSLSGRIANPLDRELENVFVVYDRSVYQFKGKLGPGDSFDVREDTDERYLVDYLNLRRVKDLGTEATPWSISDTNLRRIVEIMMFYEMAGGRGYVNLFQRYLGRIDFSFTAGSDRAILVGRTRKPASRMVIDGRETDGEYEESWTYYRILVPVEKTKRN